MNNLKFLKIAVIVLLVINLITWTGIYYVADKSDFFERKNQRKGMRHLIQEKLRLNEAQKAEFKELRKVHREKMYTLKRDISKLRKQEFALLKQEIFSSTTADSLASEIGKKQKEIELATLNHFQNLKSGLNKDQERAYFELLEKFQKSFHDKRSKRQ